MSQAYNGESQVRASDADRERIVEMLRQSAAEGRLTMDEFDQRMSAAYAAKTYGDLAGLTADLPVDLRSRGAGGRGGGIGGSGGSGGLGGGAGGPQDRVPDDFRSGPGFGSGPGSTATFGGASTTGRTPIDTATDVIGALMNAGADFRAQRELMRDKQRMKMESQRRRHEMRMARRRGRGPGNALGGWVALSILLTGVWLIQLVTDPHGGHDFWPAWPIGIIGVLALLRSFRGFGRRNY